MDDDRSRTLNLEELQEGVRDYGVDMTDEEVQQLFTTIDKDGSGSISFDEFLQQLRVIKLIKPTTTRILLNESSLYKYK